MSSVSALPSRTSEATSLSAQIRADIMPMHRQIEALPVSEALVAGTIHPRIYVHLLTQLRAFHLRLDAFIEAHSDLLNFDHGILLRTQSLDRDLAALGASEPNEHALLPITEEFASWMEDEDRRAPLALLGALYVSEGSRMGSMILARRLAQGFGVEMKPGEGIDYHLSGLTDAPKRWQRVRESIERVAEQHGATEHIRSAAVRTMEGFLSVYRDVGSYYSSLGGVEA